MGVCRTVKATLCKFEQVHLFHLFKGKILVITVLAYYLNNATEKRLDDLTDSLLSAKDIKKNTDTFQSTYAVI